MVPPAKVRLTMVEATAAEQSATVNEAAVADALHQAISRFLAAGYQLDLGAFRLLEKTVKDQGADDIPEKVIAYAARMQPPGHIVTETVINAALTEDQATPTHPEPSPSADMCEVGKSTFHPLAKDIQAHLETLKDPTDSISPASNVDNFLRCFRDRFLKLQKILRQRLDARDALTVSMAHRAPTNAALKVIGMVSRKTSRESSVALTLEDLDSELTVIVSPGKPAAWSKARYILPDAVICVTGVKGSNSVVYAEDLLWPDVPNRKPNSAPDPVYAILTSDLHIGNRFTQVELLRRFVSWLKGERGSAREREAAGRVKYVVIAGDIVDGIGVYPMQENELTISDIFRQYEAAAEILRDIPDYIEVIVTPGNHDATRRALPQPAIPSKYAAPLYECRRVFTVGNPAEVSLHGIHILLHHGRSLEDLFVQLPGVTHTRPTEAMLHLLRTRHLAPVYGGKTPLAPEARDHMVIDTPPDIYHTGHIHVYGRQTHRGTLLINSGSWQEQTLYQRKMGVKPTYGVVPVVDLQTLAVTEFDIRDI